ncbi:hypothetical protein AUK40_03855 [Candidatus Wirthbacteria bacterium CG2_30_54_11]|uniref:GIY-YIG domain-containing protein n=1 Tax=Candidatus Wirthbacteria bacterium CG2_30_54_11 TaxID=1817892 RepID=A0A1J5IJ27_9BACT|nr:MAG: hypothetical protein AUK40_03855 [Candidatus Wirthbacteria bacterium CG2_30_54_11]
MRYVYILQSEQTGRYYIGQSAHPEKRLEEHNSGKTISTRSRGPWKIVLQQGYQTDKEARLTEIRLKKLKRRDIIAKMISEGVISLRGHGV